MALEDQFALPQQGRVAWLAVRPERRAPLRVVDTVAVEPGGLVGDRYRGGSGKRAVTLIQAEHLAVIGALLGLEGPVPVALLRRNIAVAGINLLALQRQRFVIGSAVLEGTGLAHPCSRMEEALGPGGWQAMRGHGGITARVLSPGEIRLGDAVIACAADA